MATVTHAKQSGLPADSGNSGVVQPSDWYADHVLTDLPSNSAFVGVKAYLSGNQTVTANAETSLAFNGEEFDTDGFHDTVTNNTRITIPAGLGGKYLFYAELDLSSTPGSCYLQFRKNGSPYGNAVNYGGTWATSTRGSLRITETWDLVAGDYIEVRGLRTTGTVFVGTSSWVMAYKLGPIALGTPPGARAITNATLDLTTSVETLVPFAGTDDFDTDGFHNPASNNTRLTIPAGLGGRYLIGGFIAYTANTTGDRWAKITKNAGATNLSFQRQTALDDGSNASIVNVSTVADLVAGEYVELWAYQDSGGSTVDATSAAFWITRLGGSPAAASSLQGYEYDYVQITSPVSVTSTVEGTCTTCITGSAVAYDGSTVVMVEVYAPYISASANAATDNIVICLFDGATNIGRIAYGNCVVTANPARYNLHAFRKLTPSAASHTYSIKAFVSNAAGGTFDAGAGASGNSMPAFIRITRV